MPITRTGTDLERNPELVYWAHEMKRWQMQKAVLTVHRIYFNPNHPSVRRVAGLVLYCAVQSSISKCA